MIDKILIFQCDLGWESIEACQTYRASADYTAAMSQFQGVLSGPATAYFVQFIPYAPKEVINSPIVETLTFVGCTTPEADMRAQVERAKAISGCNGVASGYSIGDVDGKPVFVAVIGWESIDTSRSADKGAYVASGAEVHHVNFNFPIKGFGGL
jgi:hypothetical protein